MLSLETQGGCTVLALRQFKGRLLMKTGSEREQRALAALYERDAQVRDARPDPVVTEALARPGLSIAEIIGTAIQGYADRPALGERVTEPVTDPGTGRTSLRLLLRFDTISYRELGTRSDAVTAEWHHAEHAAIREGDLVAVLGTNSVDYATVDIACMRLGATVLPLQSSASTASLLPVVKETGPRLIASSAESLETALDLVVGSTTVRRVLVFDHHPEVDDHRERLEAARVRLKESGDDVELVTLAEVLEHGRALTPPPPPAADPDRLSFLLYTSGSTGTPKGVMYTERLTSWMLHGYFPRVEGQAFIQLSYTPLCHGMGRALLFGALLKGGTVNFVAKSDLSTLFEDIALVRPTELLLVPRICDMIFQHFQSELDRLSSGTADRAALESSLRAEVRKQFLGDRIVWAAFGAAPLSAKMVEFMESLLGLPLHDVFGSSEAGGFMIDNRPIRPPVLDYKLLDIPELGYSRTDLPHPRGELLLKAETVVPGYYNRPGATAEVFDEDGYFRTGDIMAEVGADELVYIDRAKNVLRLSQGETVALSRLETVLATADLIRQIFVHGHSERSYLLAVIVPTREALESVGGDPAMLKPQIAESIQRLAKEAELSAHEIPCDFLIETEPFTPQNGLVTDARKPLRHKLQERYGARLEALYAEHGREG
jgi:fatty acid CoA ligase FadD9